MGIGMWRKDVLLGGDSFKTLFGYNKRFLRQNAEWEQSCAPDDLERVESNIQNGMAEGENIWFDEYRFKKANSEYAYVVIGVLSSGTVMVKFQEWW